MEKSKYPGIAKLVSRLVWDQETVRSSRTTRTKTPLKSLISEGFSYSLSIAAQNLSRFILNLATRNNIIFIEEKDGQYRWKKNPFAVLEKVGADLVESTVSMSRSLGNNPQSVGKEANIWKTLYMTVAFETMA